MENILNNNTLNIADKMLLSINESDVYKNYINAKEKIKADKVLLDKMREFKQKHVQLQSKRLNNEYIDFNEENEVSRIYFYLLQNPLANSYFKCEQELTSLISDIFSKLGSQFSELLNEF